MNYNNELKGLLDLPEMKPGYLDNKNTDLGLPKVSAIVPTYNRCPHNAKDDANPLGWCLESLLAQKGESLGEIIIMDDASSDFTCEVVSDFKDKSDIPIRYFRNDRNLGSSISRNIAVDKSSYENIIFLDDDCVFSNYFIFGANFTLNELPKNTAALHLPVYHRTMNPFPISLKEIGVLDFNSSLMTGNYGGFPKEYLEDYKLNLLNNNLNILNPLKITNLGGIFISQKKLFESVGGFPDFLPWKNGYREETNLAINFSNHKYDMFFTPDPKFYSIHLKYGSKGANQNLTEIIDPTLKRLIFHSNIQRDNTGNRVDTEEWFFDRIISTYVTLGIKNIDAAKKYAKSEKENFIIYNNLCVSGNGIKINDYKKRKDIFNKAIFEGNKLIRELSL